MFLGSQMSSGISLPHDKISAEHTLSLFNDNALDCSLKEAFSHSIYILYDKSFVILQDLKNRMYFSCTACRKDLNNTKCLQEHAYSGSHLKCVEFKSDKSTFGRKCSSYEKYYLEYKLDTSKVITVGLERVEAFQSTNKRRYYKCTLCSAHGNVESMFRHLIGDKHTDKFIKTRVKLENSIITAEERNRLRKLLTEREKYGVHSIKTIYGDDFYPFVLESSSGSRTKKLEQFPVFEENDSLPSEHAEKETESENTLIVKTRSAKEEFDYIMDRFKFIVATHQLEETKFVRPEDLRMALIIMGFSLFWLHYANYSFLKCDQNNHAHYSQQKDVLHRCMGCVISQMGEIFNSKYPEMAVELKRQKPSPVVAEQNAISAGGSRP